eukprot:Nitzschia sp. Nitz4//scaffold236_size30323//19042//21951//NITZ4_007988-RA/size30323-processed-gene-0.23-mRNA-1//-1//CDS//3329543493//1544//frame0
MVKLDNWETRAEKAAERRKESKQKKHQRDRTRKNKALGQALFSFLNQHNDAILLSSISKQDLYVHIWTDSSPSDPTNDDKLAEDDELPASRKYRPRSLSHSESPNLDQVEPSTPKGKKNGRNRSNSDASKNQTPSSASKKKGRPRSGSNASDTNNVSASPTQHAPALCIAHLFGTCKAPLVSNTVGKRKSVDPSELIPACIHGTHPFEGRHNSCLSVASVLFPTNTPHQQLFPASEIREQANREALEASKNALSHYETTLMSKAKLDAHASVGHRTCMLYHHQIRLTAADLKTSTLVEQISDYLTMAQCPLGSLVYMALNDALLFDRYREGIVLTASQEELLLFGGSKRRSVSIGEYEERTSSGSWRESIEDGNHSGAVSVGEAKEESLKSLHQRLVLNMPGQVLEYILTFLPESATACLPQVCRSWHNEIGRSSPDLWKHLLQRNGWPVLLPEMPGADNQLSETERYRKMFVSHYSVVREVTTLVDAMNQLLKPNVEPGRSDVVASYDFSTAPGRAIAGPTGVRIWSDRRILVGSGEDCTLHLYDSDMLSGTGKNCKQSLRVSVAPFPPTRKMQCSMTNMDMDNRCIGCLYEISKENDEETWLGILSRDELLCSAKGGSSVHKLEEGVLKTYQLQSKILDYVMTCYDDEIVAWLYAFAFDGTQFDRSNVVVSVRESLVACGNGDFLVEAFLQTEDQEEDFMQGPQFSKVFLFSSSFGEIVWVSATRSVGARCTLRRLGRSWIHNHYSMGRHKSQSAAFLSEGQSDTVVTLNIQGHNKIEVTTVKLPRTVADRFPTIQGCISDMFLLSGTGGNSNIGQVFLVDGDAVTELDGMLEEGTTVQQMISFRDEYILHFGSHADDDSVDGQGGRQEHFAKVLHVPTKHVIYDSPMGICSEDLPLESPSYSVVSNGSSVLAVSIHECGLCWTGDGLRTFAEQSPETNGGTKTKRKKGKKQKERKDGFARGMRQNR